MEKNKFRNEFVHNCPPNLFPFNIVLEALVRAMRKKKETKGLNIRKEEIMSSLFADDLILYIKPI